jgi:hypothetical protein
MAIYRNIYLILLIIIIIFSGCISSKKYYQRGDYDRAVIKSIRNIQRNCRLDKEVPVLINAYPKANMQDEGRIKFLKAQGTPDIWDEVFEIYSKLNAREELFKTVSPLKFHNKIIDFPIVDYNADIIESKKRAAEYFYLHAKVLLKQDDKESARQAYYELNKIKSYYNVFKDDDSLSKVARIKGITNVYLDISNKTDVTLPDDLLNDLININISDISCDWVNYYSNYIDNIDFDYCIYLTLREIDIGDDKIMETHYTQFQQIQDGWEYELDRNGNVKKDTLGNDIKRPRLINVFAKITEIHQHKEVHINATVDYFNLKTNNVIHSKPIIADQYYDYIYAVAIGDLRAVNPETRKIVGLPPQSFPSGMNMIYSAGDIINKLAIEVLYENKNLIK